MGSTAFVYNGLYVVRWFDKSGILFTLNKAEMKETLFFSFNKNETGSPFVYSKRRSERNRCF